MLLPHARIVRSRENGGREGEVALGQIAGSLDIARKRRLGDRRMFRCEIPRT